MGPLGGKRRDAVANRQAVIDAAAEMLPDNPDASMQEIADFTGLGRSTVYRHFPNRETLFGAMTIEAVRTAVSQVEAILASGREPTRALREIGEFLADFGLHYRFLYSHREEARPALERLIRSPDAPIIVQLDAAAKRGEIRDDLPATWIVTQFVALTISIVGDVIGGRVDRSEAGPILSETLVAMTEVRP